MTKKTDPQNEIIEVPKAIANEVKLFINLLSSGEIDSFSDLLDLAGLSNLEPANTSDLREEYNVIEDISYNELTLTIDQETALSQLKIFTESNYKF